MSCPHLSTSTSTGTQHMTRCSISITIENSTCTTGFCWSSTSFSFDSFLCTFERGCGIMVSLLSPQQIGIPVAPQLTAAVNPEGVKQGYTSPGGLFIPPFAPEEQKRQPQQIIQKPRSQAIPIVPPKVWYNCNALCLRMGTSFLLNYHFKLPNTTNMTFRCYKNEWGQDSKWTRTAHFVHPPSSIFSERLAKQSLCRLYMNKTVANWYL